MSENVAATNFTPIDRPVRAAFVGLGRVYDLNVRGYVDNDDVDVVAIVDPSDERLAQRQGDWPRAQAFHSIEQLVASGVDVDAAEVLLPIALHEVGVIQCRESGWHVNVQKPIANDVASARRMTDASRTNGRQLRVMENYLFYEPLRKLKEVVD